MIVNIGRKHGYESNEDLHEEIRGSLKNYSRMIDIVIGLYRYEIFVMVYEGFSIMLICVDFYGSLTN